MEDKTLRKKWVKRITVVFLIMMMLLTFFSNTIMNRSLAQVSTEEIVSDSVSAKVRGTGVIEAVQASEIKLKESREVEEILVKAGDEVKEGDILIKLKEGESNEVNQAKNELEELKEEYDNKILLEEISDDIVSMAQNGGIDKNAASSKLGNLSAQVKQAQEKVNELQKKIDAIDNGTDELAIVVKDAEKEAKIATDAVEEAQNRLDSYGMDEFEIQERYENGDDSVADAKAALDELKAAKSVQVQKNAVQIKAQSEMDEKKGELSLALSEENAKLTEATDAHEKYVSEITLVNSLKSQYETIKEKETALKELELNSVGNEIKAKVAGKITEVNVEKGDMTAPDVAVVAIQESGKGYELSFSVTKEQAAKVNKGEVASITDAWYYGDVKVILSDIKADPENPSKYKKLIFTIEGDVETGQNMTVSVGEKSSKFDFVVPNNAVRQDTNGKFILIIREKSSPLGNRYVATRINVEVLRSDDAKSAISGPLEGGEYVITTSNKMIQPGDYVRLAK
ncbi:MAG: biotin/lipoyl-binding protein [Lachnospiraceae bacterium]|nr:biotin/lipoyl-binding protein [Lachnospiraceae bacterium]